MDYILYFIYFVFFLVIILNLKFKNNKNKEIKNNLKTESAMEFSINKKNVKFLKQKKLVKKNIKIRKNKLYFSNKINLKYLYSFSENCFLHCDKSNTFYGNFGFNAIEFIFNYNKKNYVLKPLVIKNNYLIFAKLFKTFNICVKLFLFKDNLYLKIFSNVKTDNCKLIINLKTSSLSHFEINNTSKCFKIDSVNYYLKNSNKVIVNVKNNNVKLILTNLKTENYVFLTKNKLEKLSFDTFNNFCDNTKNILLKISTTPKLLLFLLNFAINNNKKLTKPKEISNSFNNIDFFKNFSNNFCVLFSKNENINNYINTANNILKRINVNFIFYNGYGNIIKESDINFFKNNLSINSYKTIKPNCNKLFLNNLIKYKVCYLGSLIEVNNFELAYNSINLAKIFNDYKFVVNGKYKNLIYKLNLKSGEYLYFFSKDNKNYIKKSVLTPSKFVIFLENFVVDINKTNKNILNNLFNLKVKTEFQISDNLINYGIKSNLLNEYYNNYKFLSLYEEIFNANILELTNFPIMFVIKKLLKEKQFLKLYKYLLLNVVGIENFNNCIKINKYALNQTPVEINLNNKTINKYYVDGTLCLSYNNIVYRNIYSLIIDDN